MDANKIHQQLVSLHEALVNRFSEMLEDKSLNLKASTYAVMIQFLRDNRITVDTLPRSAAIGSLAHLKLVHQTRREAEDEHELIQSDLGLPFRTDVNEAESIL